jgi:hypothetical protein
MSILEIFNSVIDNKDLSLLDTQNIISGDIAYSIILKIDIVYDKDIYFYNQVLDKLLDKYYHDINKMFSKISDIKSLNLLKNLMERGLVIQHHWITNMMYYESDNHIFSYLLEKTDFPTVNYIDTYNNTKTLILLEYNKLNIGSLNTAHINNLVFNSSDKKLNIPFSIDYKIPFFYKFNCKSIKKFINVDNNIIYRVDDQYDFNMSKMEIEIFNPKKFLLKGTYIPTLDTNARDFVDITHELDYLCKVRTLVDLKIDTILSVMSCKDTFRQNYNTNLMDNTNQYIKFVKNNNNIIYKYNNGEYTDDNEYITTLGSEKILVKDLPRIITYVNKMVDNYWTSTKNLFVKDEYIYLQIDILRSTLPIKLPNSIEDYYYSRFIICSNTYDPYFGKNASYFIRLRKGVDKFAYLGDHGDGTEFILKTGTLLRVYSEPLYYISKAVIIYEIANDSYDIQYNNYFNSVVDIRQFDKLLKLSVDKPNKQEALELLANDCLNSVKEVYFFTLFDQNKYSLANLELIYKTFRKYLTFNVIYQQLYIPSLDINKFKLLTNYIPYNVFTYSYYFMNRPFNDINLYIQDLYVLNKELLVLLVNIGYLDLSLVSFENLCDYILKLDGINSPKVYEELYKYYPYNDCFRLLLALNYNIKNIKVSKNGKYIRLNGKYDVSTNADKIKFIRISNKIYKLPLVYSSERNKKLEFLDSSLPNPFLDKLATITLEILQTERITPDTMSKDDRQKYISCFQTSILNPIFQHEKDTIPQDVLCSAFSVIKYYTGETGFKTLHNVLKGKPITSTYLGYYKDGYNITVSELPELIICLNKFIWHASDIFKERQLTDELCRVKPRITLYRGTTLKDIPLTIGSIINSTKRQFLSFTTSLKRARNFSDGVIFKIVLNSRSDTFLPIANIQFSREYLSHSANEKEYLLPIETSLIIAEKPYMLDENIIVPVRIHRQKQVNSFKVYTEEELQNITKI